MAYVEFDANDTWSVPRGVTRVFIECWGPGGDGGDSNCVALGGAGGGGGAYANKIEEDLVYEDSFVISIGAANDTEASLSGVVVVVGAACGGEGGPSAEPDQSGTPGAGGLASACVGDTKISGQDGTANGVGGDGANGGEGGAKGDAGHVNGYDGVAPGGGGGGAYKGTSSGGSAAGGKCRITWYKDNEVVNVITNA